MVKETADEDLAGAQELEAMRRSLDGGGARRGHGSGEHEVASRGIDLPTEFAERGDESLARGADLGDGDVKPLAIIERGGGRNLRKSIHVITIADTVQDLGDPDWTECITDAQAGEPPPPLPEEIVEKTRAKYIEAYELLTGDTFS